MADFDDPGDRDPRDDLGDDADPPERAVPDPMDRLWRHPSELGALARPRRQRNRLRLRRQRAERRRGTRVFVPIGSALAGAGATLILLTAFGSVDLDQTTTAAADSIPRTAQPTVVVDRLAPSIVAITARDANGLRRGSGVVLRHRGEVLTNARLVGAATSVSVLTIGGERVPAKVIGVDLAADLALVTIGRPLLAAPLLAAPLAERMPGVGQPIYAIGADPSGHATPRVSRGIVSSTDGLVAQVDGPAMAGLIEIDALAEAASAGGALVDTEGNVLGVLLGPTSARRGALALPISFAAEIAGRLRSRGSADHGWLGLNGVDSPHGPIVFEVVTSGPAAIARLQVGDVVLSVDGRAVDTMTEVTAVVRRHWPGDEVDIRVRRGGWFVMVTVQLGATPPRPVE